MIEPIQLLRGTKRYQRKTSPRPIDLRLDANEGGREVAKVIEALSIDVESVRRYPDARELEAMLAARLSVEPERVLVTAGADDALERVCRATLEPGRKAVFCTPTFEMLRRYVRMAGAEGVEISWPSGVLPTDELIRAGRDATVLFVVSPNNPTGCVASSEDLRRLRGSLPETLIVLDAAYGEFADDDLTQLALSMPATVVTRTFSKAWSAAGLRVGYVAGGARVIEWLRAVGQPYAVSGLSLLVAKRLLETAEPRMRALVNQVRAELSELTQSLMALGADPIVGQANFVLARFDDSAFIADAVESLGIAVRRFEPQTGLSDHLRIGLPGDSNAFERLRHALESALAPQAIIFDLDGPLADVSRSYREAIRQTCASFGVDVMLADVAAIKAQGYANNDWVVAQRLLASRGVEVSLDRVTDAFERLYQGGLRRNETLLCESSWLAELRNRLSLAIVTGRPREDAQRFLREHGIEGLFGAVVCMEDAPLKPDPAPVRLALERLNVGRAWMLGDTPDDIVAARAAGVIPIGVVACGESRDRVEPNLLSAGAARVLNRVTELSELLP